MDLLINCYDYEKKIFLERNIRFEEDETVVQMLNNNFERADCYFAFNIDKSGLYSLDYYFDENEKVHWDSFIQETKMRYLLSRYPNIEKDFTLVINRGGIGAATGPLDFVIQMVLELDHYFSSHPLELYVCQQIFEKVLNKVFHLGDVKKRARSYFATIECRNCMSYNNSILSKEEWKITDLKTSFGHDDLNLWIPYMKMLNYEFNTEEMLFIKNDKKDKINIPEFMK